MGRKKIQISRITDERNRQVTFNKRKFGVMKKAYELSVLCDCEIALIIFSSSNKLYQYASTDMDKVLLKYTEYNEPHESLTNKNIIEALSKKEHKNGLQSPDSPDSQPGGYVLNPKTQAHHDKVDEDFKLMMQKPMNGSRPSLNISNYTNMQVSVPVQNKAYEPVLMQPSPQMSHASLSPRPGSSSGILDMNNSNGYSDSTSPLPPGGAPSPGLLTRTLTTKALSPTRPNLRVQIPSSQSQLSQRTNSPALNTPVVPNQPGAEGGIENHNPAMTYSGLGPFQHHEFAGLQNDINLSSITSLSHQWHPGALGQSSTMAHSTLPHLSVNSSTPSPISVSPALNIKSEPSTPPREQHSTVSHLMTRPSSADPGHLSPVPPIHLQQQIQSHNIFTSGGLSTSRRDTGHLTPTSHMSPEGPHHSSDYESIMNKRVRHDWTT